MDLQATTCQVACALRLWHPASKHPLGVDWAEEQLTCPVYAQTQVEVIPTYVPLGLRRLLSDASRRCVLADRPLTRDRP
jgi:hypothetical protein